MSNEAIDKMMSRAAKFYYMFPIPGIRAIPLMICTVRAAKALKQRRLERLNLES